MLKSQIIIFHRDVLWNDVKTDMDLFSPELLSPLIAVGLIILAGFTSCITAALGAGGGLLLLVLMALVMPIWAVIPVHGLVQLGSNANRALMTRRYLDSHMFTYFVIGALFGAGASSFFVSAIPLQWMKVLVGSLVLYLIWGAIPPLRQRSPVGRIMAGLVTTFLSMFIGASGPMVGSYMHANGYAKHHFTATFSSCMTVQHTLKAFVFAGVGFSFWQWLPLVLAMIVSGFVGTWLGLKLLHRIPENRFRFSFKLILTVLTINLIWQGASTLL